MIKTRYSHAFLVGRINTKTSDATLIREGWEHVVTDESSYSDFCNYYYQGHVNAMVECPMKPATFPPFLSCIRHFRRIVNKNAIIPQRDYHFKVCFFHLFFFPLNITLLAIEIDDSSNLLDALTWGHNELMGWKDNFAKYPVWTKTVFKPLEVLLDKDDNRLFVEGNKLKIYQIINIPEEAISHKDALLYELATSSPVGCVEKRLWISPSQAYYNNIMNQNSVSAFKDWKALALNDSFTMLDCAEKSPKRETWDDNYRLWLQHYFRLIYLRCFFEKTFCLSRNIAYRQGEAVDNLSSEITDMERYYFYKNISYNFLPNMLYDAMSHGLGISAEREEISKQIKERAKEEEVKRKEQKAQKDQIRKDAEEKEKEKEAKRFDRILAYVAIFAVFSVTWDICSIVMKAVPKLDTPCTAAFFAIAGIVIAASFVYQIKSKQKNETG